MVDKIVVGRAQKPFQIQCSGPASFPEQLYTWYARFNGTNPVEDRTLTNTSYVPTPISVEDPKVISMLSNLHPRKAPVSDRLKSCVLRECAAQQGDEQVKIFKGIVHRKMEIIHYLIINEIIYQDLLTNMRMEEMVKCLSPHDTFGVLGVNSVSAIVTTSSDVIKQQEENITCLHTAHVVSSNCPEAPTFIIDSNRHQFHQVLGKKSNTGSGKSSFFGELSL